jgi:hypothetical protein
VLTTAIVLTVLVGAGIGVIAVVNHPGHPTPYWKDPASVGVKPSSGVKPTAVTKAFDESDPAGTVSLAATGDIIMGSAPSRLPPNGGSTFFDDVRGLLKADLVMGNLEQPVTEDTGFSKCQRPGPPATPGGPATVTVGKDCHAFRVPPAYAGNLKAAGFGLLNTANNHTRDYGVDGARNTLAALDQAGLRHTGGKDEITVVQAGGMKVAVLGFSSYAGANSLIDLTQARSVVRAAAGQADLVVVQVHMGAEGAKFSHVKPGAETFLHENRGDPMKFARAVIDAGADLVIGHGPHVLRGMEFYQGRLIAYSLGNFAGGQGTLNRAGPLGVAGVLTVSLKKDGSFAKGAFRSTALTAAGAPSRDAAERGRALLSSLSTADFGATAARIGSDGAITEPS